MRGAISDVIDARAPEDGSLTRRVGFSLAVHVVVGLTFILIPSHWLSGETMKPNVIEVSLAGSAGAKTTGVAPIAGQRVDLAVPEPTRSATATPAPPPIVPAKTPEKLPTPAVTPPAQVPATGAQVQAGTAVIETGATGKGPGITQPGGGGSGEAVDLNTFDPVWTAQMRDAIIKHWAHLQQEIGWAEVLFVVAPDGTVIDRRVPAHSSGSAPIQRRGQITMRVTFFTASVLLSAALAAWTPPVETPDVTSMPLHAQQTEIRTEIGRESGRLPRLAIPTFLVNGSDTELRDAAQTLTDVLWKDLEFEREFSMISQAGAAIIPPAPAETLNYDSWNQIGADDVLVGRVQSAGGNLEVVVRVMSVERKVSTFGRQYTCSTRGIRQCAHTIADNLHKERFGLDGVARTKFAFSSDRDGERIEGSIQDRSVKEIYIADYDGERASRVTVRGSLNIAPSWAPDGRAIVYQSYQSAFADIYVQQLYEVQTRSGRPGKGTDRVQNYLPAWSPDGKRIAYASSVEDNWDIFVVNVDGTDPRRLTTHNATDSAPAWSPNGTQIAFTSDRAGTNQIYIMSADGGPVTKITNEPKNVDRPTWALDFIAYSAELPGSVVQIKKINVGTRQVTQLTSGPGSNESPTVAPNGRHIAFVTTRWGTKQQIAVMDADGKNVRQITFTGNNRFPRWSNR